MTRLVVLAALLACSGCKQATHTMSVHDQRQLVLDGIADKCGLPRNTLRLVGDDELHMQPPANAKYESVDCMLTEVRKSGFPLKLGFVGNKYYSNEVE